MEGDEGGALTPARKGFCAMANVQDRIQKLISENPVVLFMKGTPEFPQCGFSGQVVQILDYLGAPVVGVNVLEDAEIRQGIKEFANWPTIPQLYVKGEFIGGSDIAREMFQSGELAAVLAEAGVATKQSAKA
jgi:monothiol glutaredoxin